MSGRTNREEFKLKLNKMISDLREKIIKGDILIGEYLPSELILASQYELSKNSVRKGLEELVGEGLIVKKSRIGNIVVSNSPLEQVTLRVGYYPSLVKDANLPDLISKFEEEYPNIKIQSIALPYQNYKETVNDFFFNDMIDVVTLNHWDFTDFQTIKKEIFEPMPRDQNLYTFLEDPFVDDADKEQVYVKPFVFSPVVLCYNKDHFDNKQIPYPDSSWKWNDALEAAKQLLIEDSHDRTCGLYFHPLSINRWPIFLLQNRVRFQYNELGDVHFPITELIGSVNFIRNLFEEQGILQTFLSDNDRDAEKLFLEQKVSMIVTTYFSLNEIKNHSISYDIAPIPYLDDAQTLLLIIGLAINTRSTKKDTAKLFVDFITNEESQKFIRKETLSIPAHKKVAERDGDDLRKKPARYHLFREIIPSYKLYSDLGLTSRDLSELRNELRIYLSDLMDDKIFVQRISAKLSYNNRKTIG